MCSASSFTSAWKFSFFETKSVSEFTSTRTALFPSATAAVSPSAATRSAFFSALAIPSHEGNQSLFPYLHQLRQALFFTIHHTRAGFFSRSSLTILAVTAMFVPPNSCFLHKKKGSKGFISLYHPFWSPSFKLLSSLQRQLLLLHQK